MTMLVAVTFAASWKIMSSAMYKLWKIKHSDPDIQSK